MQQLMKAPSIKKIIGSRYAHLLNPDKRTADNILIPYGSVIPLNTKNGRQDVFKLRIELPGQNKSTYKICETYEIADLLNILVDLGYQVDKNNITKEEAREIARSSNYSSPPNIGEKLSKKYLTQVGYILYDIEQEQVADRKVLCGIIQKLLKERNAFFTLREW